MSSGEIWAAEEALIDRVIAGKFRLRRCVGAGSSGAVYQADQIALGRTVAVKILRPELAADPRLCARFHDEALAASRLNHPNTVAVIDYGQTEDQLLYLVMEFLRGNTLTELLRDAFPLPPMRTVDIISQILLGIEEAHAAGVVHADLKADNIVVEERRADWDLVKVVDFGIARLLGHSREKADADNDRFICGTPEYMAPEVIRGADPTFASDLYAVGVIIYELLCGSTPFAGGTSLDVLTRHLREEPVPPSERFPELSVNVPIEEVALRALAKDPADRFASAREFREALSRAVGRRPATHSGEVVCSGCGVLSPASFKFCPECGRPRAAAGSAGAAAGSATPTLTDHDSLTLGVTARVDIAEGSGPSAADGTLSLFPLPLVDRDDAMAALKRFSEHADTESIPRLCTIVGSRGSGRSRLVRELCDRIAHSQDSRVVYLAAPDPTGIRSPFYPMRSLVAGILGLPPFCSYESLAAAVATAGLSSRDLTGITELFGNAGEISELEAVVRRRELYASTLRALWKAAPALIVFEDADEYDGPSQELLRRLIESHGDGDLRMIVTGNAELADRLPAGLRIDLGPISARGARALAAHLARRCTTAIEPRDLADRAGDSPGTFEQLARYLVEGGSLASAPSGIADLIAARLELLPRPALLLAQAAAALGWAAAEEDVRATAHVADAAFDEAANTLVARGLVTREDRLWRFERPIIRDVIYEATPADVRRSLHAAAFLSIAGGADEAVLGHHAELADRTRDAAELLSKGGDAFVHQLDDSGAGVLFHRALGAARRVMLAETDNSSRALFVSISVKLADSLRVTGRPGLARGVVDEALDQCQDAPLLKAQLLRASAHLAAAQRNLDRAVQLSHQAIGLGITAGRRDLLVDLYLDAATFHAQAGHTQAAIAELEEGIDLITLGAGAAASDAPKAFWRMVLRLGRLCGTRGDHNRAIALGEEAYAQAQRAGSKLGSARSQSLLAVQFEELGDDSRAAHYRRRAVKELRRIGDRRGTAELLLAGSRGTLRVPRASPESLAEARELAAEVGWVEALEQLGEGTPA